MPSRRWQCEVWLQASLSLPPAHPHPGCGVSVWVTPDYTQQRGADGESTKQSALQAALVVAGKNLLTVDMASTFPSCVVCGGGGGGRVVFPLCFSRGSASTL